MGGSKRVPQKDSEFDTYIRNTTAVLEAGTPTGAVRLDLTTTQATQWIDYRDQWVILYPKYTDPAQRTTTIKNSKNKLKKDFTAFAAKPLLRIESSDNLTEDDRGTFHLPGAVKTKSPRGPIDDKPFGTLVPKGSGLAQLRARRAEDSTRSSMHKWADAVEFRYKILDNNGPAPTPGGGPDQVPTAADCPNSVTSKKALFRVNFGLANEGKRIIGFLRWINIDKAEYNSGWSLIITAVL